jgi:hypothetical protein
MVTLTMGKTALQFLLSEANFHRSRENIIILSGQGVLAAGTVIGRGGSAAGAASSAAKAGGNTGNGTLTVDAATPVLGNAKAGIYKVRFIAAAANNGTFRVEDPDGDFIGEVVMAGGAGAFAEQIKFAIADGATDFIVGDGFDVTVTANATKWKAAAASAVDGSEIARGILAYPVDATSADVAVAAIVRDAEVKAGELAYHADSDTAAERLAIAQQLADVGIIVR